MAGPGRPRSGPTPAGSIGAYGSGLVRAVAPLVCDAGRLLWNHGGAADDLARPGLVSLPAPASSYFEGAVREAAARRVDRLLVARGAGPFAGAVAQGAVERASARGIEARTVMVGALAAADAAGGALLVVGRFQEDVAVVRRVRGWPRAPALLGAVAAELAAARGRALRSRPRRPLSAPDGPDVLVRGGPGHGHGLRGACRPAAGPGGRDRAAVDDLDVAGGFRPGRRLAAGRPSRGDHRVAAGPDGPGRPGFGGRPWLGLEFAHG